MNRRTFFRGLGGLTAATVLGGCCSKPSVFGCGNANDRGDKLKFGVIGAGGQGWTDWRNMFWNGVLPVAVCDVNRRAIDRTLAEMRSKGCPTDSIRTYSDYRRMIDDQAELGMDFVTVSTPDHMHAPQAITAMRAGLHCYIQTPLVRTLWENDRILKVAKDSGCLVQMGDSGSAGDGLRRHVELVQQGVLGEIREIYAWTDCPLWSQGEKAKAFAAGREAPPPPELDWDSWLGTAKYRACPEAWSLAQEGTDRSFNWRAYYDFGTGAFGDKACQMLNLPYRGAELGNFIGADVRDIGAWSDVAFPTKSRVDLYYGERPSKARAGVTLPSCQVHWSEGGLMPQGESIAPLVKYLRDRAGAGKPAGANPPNGCILVGSKGLMASLDPYGNDCVLQLAGEKEPRDTKVHEACAWDAVPVSLPRVLGNSNDTRADLDREQTGEFLRAIRGEATCFSDIDYATGILEGVLVGCLAQRLRRPLAWNAAKRRFNDPDANALMHPFVRPGWEF